VKGGVFVFGVAAATAFNSRYSGVFVADTATARRMEEEEEEEEGGGGEKWGGVNHH